MKRNVVVVFVVDPTEYTKPTEAEIGHYDADHIFSKEVDRLGIPTTYYEDNDDQARTIVIEALRGNCDMPHYVIPTDLIYTGDPTMPRNVGAPPTPPPP